MIKCSKSALYEVTILSCCIKQRLLPSPYFQLPKSPATSTLPPTTPTSPPQPHPPQPPSPNSSKQSSSLPSQTPNKRYAAAQMCNAPARTEPFQSLPFLQSSP